MRQAFRFIGALCSLPLKGLSWVISAAYVGFLVINGLFVLAMPLIWDLYMAQEARYTAALRATWFYEETQFISMPVVFAALVFFNLLFANSITTTAIGRGRWGLFQPVSYAPIALAEFRILFRALLYYAAVAGLDMTVGTSAWTGTAQRLAQAASTIFT